MEILLSVTVIGRTIDFCLLSALLLPKFPQNSSVNDLQFPDKKMKF